MKLTSIPVESQKERAPKRVGKDNRKIAPRETLTTQSSDRTLVKNNPTEDELTDKNYKICGELQCQDRHSTGPANGIIHTRGTKD